MYISTSVLKKLKKFFAVTTFYTYPKNSGTVYLINVKPNKVERYSDLY